MSNPVVTALGGIAATYVFFWAMIRLTQDSNEPPTVSITIPFISPILGMIRWSMEYYSHMRIPGTRIYVINSIDLIPAVQRQWRTLIFGPIQVKAARAAMGASREAVTILEQDLITEHGFINGMVKAIHPTMSNGPALDALNLKAFEVFNEALNQFSAPTTVKLFGWIGEQIMCATTDAVYGLFNPIRDSENLKSWHKYHPSLMFLMLDILPQKPFFTSALRARSHLLQSFTKYYLTGGHTRGSAYIRNLVSHCKSQKLPEADIPRFLLGSVFNNVANTIPSAFWVIWHIFSDPVILSECRNEVVESVQWNNHDGTSTIDINFLLNSCPILMSTYNEVFRFHGMANSAHVVSEDHLLDNRYLLKKGGLVMMSARAQHQNPDIWGDDVSSFSYKRFLKTSTGKKSNPVAFRPFGGGTTLCPGRHFATSEILLLTALLLLRFDVRWVSGAGGAKGGNGEGTWITPQTGNSSQAEAMEQPDTDVEVEFVPRGESSRAMWRVSFEGRVK